MMKFRPNDLVRIIATKEYCEVRDFRVDDEHEEYLLSNDKWYLPRELDYAQISMIEMKRFSLRDIGKSYMQLLYDDKHIADIFYNTPNRISYGNQEFFVETPYSSLDERYHIYKLTEGQVL